MATDTYERIYRETHPRIFPYSPWERQLELRDLWPSEQQKFRNHVDYLTRIIADTHERWDYADDR
jgi:hypothetical protein